MCIRQFISALGVVAALFVGSVHAEAPRYVDPADDAAILSELGAESSLLFLKGDAQIAAFRNVDALAPVRQVASGDNGRPLPEAARDFSDLRYAVDGAHYDLDHFMRHNHVGGLLVLKDGDIVLERYGLGNTRDTRWVSFSVTKSVVSLLVGAAIREGYIGSVDDPVTDYLPQLRDSAYEGVNIRHVLQMASGTDWNEDYADPQSDVASSPPDMLELMHFLGAKPRVAEPGAVFNYNTGETNLAGAIVRAAVGNNLGAYLSRTIWQPWGMETDATWMAHGPQGGEWGGCCISPTLRDWGRLGLFLLNDGVLDDGTRVLPEGWLTESLTPSPAADHYGYLWWLPVGGRFRALGIFGQAIHVNPEARLIIAVQGAWPLATSEVFGAHRDAFFAAVEATLAD
ncbi:MAG: serine hydrolase [Gammaproteobacteria bacterium]|nr:serine hydrolase [Gammaproteobacteria bacterium]